MNEKFAVTEMEGKKKIDYLSDESSVLQHDCGRKHLVCTSFIYVTQ